MTNRQMAESYLAQAGEIIIEAHGAFERGVWNLVVRRCQEVVELALKAALRLAGIEVPHIHDVGILLKDHEAKFPEPFRRDIGRMASISRQLRREREASFYGDEETGSPPHRLYTEDDAKEALHDAGFVLERCRGLV
ncbi:MAG: HEPN domain-containing protein [Armatimonadota bacterium]|nr:HEPN domain-containing protein [Armatimonadota bacterium]